MAGEHRLNLRFTDEGAWNCLCSYAAGKGVSMNEAVLRLVNMGLAFENDGVISSAYLGAIRSMLDTKLAVFKQGIFDELGFVQDCVDELRNTTRASSIAVLAAVVDTEKDCSRSRDENLEHYRNMLPYLADGYTVSEAEVEMASPRRRWKTNG